MLKAILFDFDGVIVDGIAINDGCYIDTFNKIGIEVDLNHLHTKIGMTTGQVIRSMLEDYKKVDIDPVYVEKMMQENVLECYETKSELPPYLVDFLSEIKEAGLKTAIASGSHSRAINAVLKKFKLEGYFDVIIGGEQVTKGKPNPELWIRALAELGVDPTDALAIDDAKSGIMAAKKVGIPTIAYLHFSKKPIEIADCNVSSFNEIKLNDYLQEQQLV